MNASKTWAYLMGLLNGNCYWYSVSNMWFSFVTHFPVSKYNQRYSMGYVNPKANWLLFFVFYLNLSLSSYEWIDSIYYISLHISEVSWKWRLKPHGTATNTHTQTMRTELIFFVWLFLLLSNVVSHEILSPSTKTHTHTLRNLQPNITTYNGVNSRNSAKKHITLNGESIKNTRKALPQSRKRWILID